ncbi:MAG: hypothetical protein HZA50_15815 [Planctomycetes bacterium]|nr:hypothetical protein [Planctomycetota bacterium]
MTARKKMLILFAVPAAVLIATGAWVYSYYTAPQRKIEKLLWELRGCPEGRLDSVRAKIGIKSDKPEPRYAQVVFTELAGYGKLATPYLIELVKDKNFHGNGTAEELLAQINDPAVIGFFRQCLKNRGPATWAAAPFLKETCGSQSLLEFADLIKDSNDLMTAGVIAEALGDIGGRQSVDLLIAAWRQDYGNSTDTTYWSYVNYLNTTTKLPLA